MDCGLSGLCIDDAELARLCNFACVEAEDATLAAAMAPPWLDMDMLMNCALWIEDGDVAAERVCLYAMMFVAYSTWLRVCTAKRCPRRSCCFTKRANEALEACHLMECDKMAERPEEPFR